MYVNDYSGNDENGNHEFATGEAEFTVDTTFNRSLEATGTVNIGKDYAASDNLTDTSFSLYASQNDLSEGIIYDGDVTFGHSGNPTRDLKLYCDARIYDGTMGINKENIQSGFVFDVSGNSIFDDEVYHYERHTYLSRFGC